MKTEFSLEEAVSDVTLDLADRFLRSEQSSFAEQVRFLGLNPRSDFRHADLAYVDFSDSDLRGFDFTGADLRGAIGVNTRFDSTTKLTDAETSDSLFAYTAQRERYFADHIDQAERVGRLATDYWANTIINVATLLESGKNKAAALQIAKAVFEDTKDPTVRTSILMHMGAVEDSREEQKAFIHHLLAKFGNDRTAIRPALNTLRFQYRNDLDAFNVMLKFLSHNDGHVRTSALAGVLSSSLFFSAFGEVRKNVLQSANPSMRRALVGRIAGKELKTNALLLEDDMVFNFVDFRETITLDKLARMARRSFHKVTQTDAETVADYIGFKMRFDETDADIDRARLIQRCLTSIREKYGIPFDVYEGEISKRNFER